MLIITKKTETKEIVIEKNICDICKKDINISDIEYKREINNFDNFYNIDLELTSGMSYGSDGGSEEGEAIDVCFKCAKEKVMPLIKETFNITPRKINNDW